MRRAYSAADCGKQAGISSDMGSPVEYVAISNHRHLRSKLKGIPVSDRALQWGGATNSRERACPASMGCNFKSQKSGHIVGNNDGESL